MIKFLIPYLLKYAKDRYKDKIINEKRYQEYIKLKRRLIQRQRNRLLLAYIDQLNIGQQIELENN